MARTSLLVQPHWSYTILGQEVMHTIVDSDTRAIRTFFYLTFKITTIGDKFGFYMIYTLSLFLSPIVGH